MTSAKQNLRMHLQNIDDAICSYSPPEKIHPIIGLITSIRTIAHERTDDSIYKKIALGQMPILSTMLPLSKLPRSENIVTSATGMIVSPDGSLKAGYGASVFRTSISFDDWWEVPHQAIDGYSMTRKEVLLASQLDGILHGSRINKPGVRTLADLDQSHFQYILQYGYELLNSPSLVSYANL